MADNKVTLNSPEAYVEYCLEEISREISMAAANHDFSSILIESLLKIQKICNTGLENPSISDILRNYLMRSGNKHLPRRVLSIGTGKQLLAAHSRVG